MWVLIRNSFHFQWDFLLKHIRKPSLGSDSLIHVCVCARVCVSPFNDISFFLLFRFCFVILTRIIFLFRPFCNLGLFCARRQENIYILSKSMFANKH